MMTFGQRLRILFGEKCAAKMTGLLLSLTLGAVLEVGGIGMILPFMAVAKDPGIVNQYPWAQELCATLGLNSGTAIIAAMGLAFIGFFLVKSIYLFFMYSSHYRFLYTHLTLTGQALFSNFLHNDYAWHMQKNSAELLRTVTHDVYHLYHGFFSPGIALLVELAVFALIGVLLLLVQPMVALVSIAVLGGLNGLFFIAIKAKLDRLGKSQQQHHGDMFKWLNQGFGGIKEIKIAGREQFFVDSFHASGQQYSNALCWMNTVRQTPKLVIETTIVFALIMGVMIVTAREDKLEDWIPVASVFALAAVRLMPSLNRIAIAATSIRYYASTFTLVTDRVVETRVKDVFIPHKNATNAARAGRVLQQQIEISNLSYTYPGSDRSALDNVSLVIPKGAAVAFVGPSGAGKSTLMDLLLGLLQPTNGSITVDGESVAAMGERWHSRIGYVPQNMYLLDTTIERNVAFGIPDAAINHEKVARAVRHAQLDELIRSLPEGLQTIVGERGVRLSGGQAQRIAIARALYGDPEILVLDEATSALDLATEKAINEAITTLAGERTILIITHRLASVDFCQHVYRIESGRVEREK